MSGRSDTNTVDICKGDQREAKRTLADVVGVQGSRRPRTPINHSISATARDGMGTHTVAVKDDQEKNS